MQKNEERMLTLKFFEVHSIDPGVTDYAVYCVQLPAVSFFSLQKVMMSQLDNGCKSASFFQSSCALLIMIKTRAFQVGCVRIQILLDTN